MIIGHKEQRKFLQNAVEKNKAPQAIIFSGKQGLGKKMIALEFIDMLNQNKMNRADLIYVEAEEQEIKIDQIRDLQKELSFSPQFSDFKAVVIDNAHLLNKLAQNCFLKTLEEPKGKTFFAMVTSHPEMLLPTIRSRSAMLKFYPLSEQEMKKYFNQEIVEIAEGRPGIGFQFSDNKALLAEHQKKVKAIKNLLKENLAEKFAFAQSFVKKNSKQELIEFIKQTTGILRQAMIEDIESAKFSHVKEKIETAEKISFLLSTTNVNQRLAFENLMLIL